MYRQKKSNENPGENYLVIEKSWKSAIERFAPNMTRAFPQRSLPAAIAFPYLLYEKSFIRNNKRTAVSKEIHGCGGPFLQNSTVLFCGLQKRKSWNRIPDAGWPRFRWQTEARERWTAFWRPGNGIFPLPLYFPVLHFRRINQHPGGPGADKGVSRRESGKAGAQYGPV